MVPNEYGALFPDIRIMKAISNKISGCPGRLRRLLLAVCLVVCSLGAAAERWKLHPGFDDAPLRIIDTEKYTFFAVFQQFYDLNYSTCNQPVTAGFIYRKDAPEEGIVPAGDILNLNGSGIRTCEYSPDGKFLAILYLDGGLDFLDDNGEIRHCDFIKNRVSPYWDNVKSFTLSGKEVWIVTAGGYVAVDGTSGNVTAQAEIPENINLRWMGRCGDRIVMLTNDRIYDAPAANPPRSYADFNSVWMPSGWWGPNNLMPRDDTSFFFLSNSDGAGGYQHNIAWHDGEKWNFREINKSHPVLSSWGGVVSNIFERNYFRNKKGWLFTTAGGMHQLYNDRDPEAADIIESLPGLKKEDPSAIRVLSMAGSWDGTTCFAYHDRGKFAPGSCSDWKWFIDDEAALRPKAPSVGTATHLGYSPDYGTLAMNYGTSWAFAAIMNRPSPLLTAYKDGEWTYPNSMYSIPRSAESNEGMMTAYQNNIVRFPVPCPNGMIVDPANKDYVWFGSAMGGMAAFNLRDPKADPIHLGSPADPLAAYPGFYALLENPERWNGYAPLSTPSFDGEGNLWTAHHYYVERPGKGMAQLFCWPRANREKVMASGNVKEIEGIKTLELGPDDLPNSYMKCAATTSPKARNLVFVYLTNSPRRICRLNHGGTLDDPSDDKMEYFQYVEDQNGSRWPVSECNRLVEEPSTGMMWLADYAFLVGFDPNGEIKDGVIKGTVIELDDKEYQGNPLAFFSVQDVAFDDFGRMWVATAGAGVWGFSADKKRVIAHYTVADSFLPDDRCYGLVWNPATCSLMVSTYGGLAEVWPDIPDAVQNVQGAVAAWPREVTPDYTGPVTVSGLLPGTTLYVADRDGKDVAALKADGDGRALWSLTDDAGKSVGSGFYILKGTFGEIEIVVMR